MILKSNVFKFSLVLVLFAFSINISPRWKLINSDPEYGLEEYELNLDVNQVFTVSCRDLKGGEKRLALTFISVDEKSPQYHWCFFVDGKVKNFTPGAYKVLKEHIERGIYHAREGLPVHVQELIEKAFDPRKQKRKEKENEDRKRISVEYASGKINFRGIFYLTKIFLFDIFISQIKKGEKI